MKPDQARAFYQVSYFRGGDYDDYSRDESTIKRNFVRLAQSMAEHKPDGRLLEVGCAYGFFLDVAQTHWAVEGIDVSEAAVAAARIRHPARVYCGDLLTVPLQPETYDWIVAWDVIEHLDKPRDYLRRVAELLRPGGRLGLTTGDLGSPAARAAGRRWRLLTPPSHLTFFTREGLRRALSWAGLTEDAIGTVGYERTLRFTLFRLLGPTASARLLPPGTWQEHLTERLRFYVNLGDVVLLIARKPHRDGTP